MRYKIANRLPTILGIASMILLVTLTTIWLRSPSLGPEQAVLPTQEVTAVLPTISISSIEQAATPTLPLSSPAPTETPVIRLVQATATPQPTRASINHVVQPGETLTDIATQYSVSIADIVAANDLSDPDAIGAGQTLLIPVNPVEQSTSAAIVTDAAADLPMQPTVSVLAPPLTTNIQPDWPPSRTGDGLAENYPLISRTSSGNVIIYYQPGTYPDLEITALTQTIDDIWNDIQIQLGKSFPRTVDIYLAGTLFAINPALQGLAQSWQYRAFVLVNGTFHPGEEHYIIAHELTHIAATHSLGPVSSVMLHEGLAVHLPQSYLTEEASYLPHTEICASTLNTPAFRSAVQMHAFSYGPTGFGGHIRNFFHYNLSGCFVTYLIETYGLEKFDRLYDSGDYQGIYGRSLSDLDQEWRGWLTTIPLTIDPEQLIASVSNVAVAYDAYVAASTGGVHANWEAYLHLNRARLAANQGLFDLSEIELVTFYDLFSPNSHQEIENDY
jgi:LysM repeat protein